MNGQLRFSIACLATFYRWRTDEHERYSKRFGRKPRGAWLRYLPPSRGSAPHSVVLYLALDRVSDGMTPHSVHDFLAS